MQTHCVHHTQKHKPWKFQIILLVFTQQLSGNAQTPRYFLFLCLKLEDKNILTVICSKQKFQYDFFSHWCLAISLYMLVYSLLGSQVNIICLCGKHYSVYCPTALYWLILAAGFAPFVKTSPFLLVSEFPLNIQRFGVHHLYFHHFYKCIKTEFCNEIHRAIRGLFLDWQWNQSVVSEQHWHEITLT